MESVLQRYGMTVDVIHGGVSSRVKAFFQPMGSKAAKQVVTPLGITPQDQYLYMGPAQQPVDPDEEIAVDGRVYRVMRSEAVRNGEQIVYRWAVCRRKGGKDTWVTPL